MRYTIKIDDKSSKAKSIINMLEALAKDNDFLSVYKEPEFAKDLIEELDSRYELAVSNPDVGKNWDEVKRKLSGK